MTQNGHGWTPPFSPLTLSDLLHRLHEADWPARVVLHPVDFAACAQGGVPVQRDPETGDTGFYIGTTKIVCRPARADTLDLSDRPTRILTPR
jgi:hypothetical protein